MTRTKAAVPLDSETPVCVRRHWDDYNIGTVPFGKLSGFRWDQVSGGFGRASPKPMVYAYMLCTDFISGGVGHSCSHGPAPHNIKVVVVKKDNGAKVVSAVRALADADRERHRAASVEFLNHGGAGVRLRKSGA